MHVEMADGAKQHPTEISTPLAYPHCSWDAHSQPDMMFVSLSYGRCPSKGVLSVVQDVPCQERTEFFNNR